MRMRMFFGMQMAVGGETRLRVDNGSRFSACNSEFAALGGH